MVGGSFHVLNAIMAALQIQGRRFEQMLNERSADHYSPLSTKVDMSFCTIMQLQARMKHRCLFNRVSVRVPAVCRSLHKLVIAL